MIVLVAATKSYDAQGVRLVNALDEMGVSVAFRSYPDRGSWVANTLGKVECLYEFHEAHDEPVLWVDADSTVLRAPHEEDVACWQEHFDIVAPPNYQYRRKTTMLRTPCVFVNCTEEARRFLASWFSECCSHPSETDEFCLEMARRKRMGRTRVGLMGREYAWSPRVEPDESVVFVFGLSAAGALHMRSREGSR